MTTPHIIPDYPERLQEPDRRDLSGWGELRRRLRVALSDYVVVIESVLAGLLIAAWAIGMLAAGGGA